MGLFLLLELTSIDHHEIKSQHILGESYLWMEPVVLSRYLSRIMHDCRENLGHTCKYLARVLSLSLSLDIQKAEKLTKKENGGDEGLIVIPLGLLSPLISKSVPPHFAKDNAQPFVCSICKCVICNQPCIRLIHND